MKNYSISINSAIKAQSSIEFSLALISAVLFLVLTCNFFVWCGHTIVQRQVAYEASRVNAASNNNPGQLSFYAPSAMNLLKSGGY